ncbi:MAG: translation initiation factor eIF-2B [Thermoproteota archaeon]
MLGTIYDTASKIRSVEIQGARNVAIAAVKALERLASETKAKTKKDFLSELLEAKEILFDTRETEPLMRNSLRWVIDQVEESEYDRVSHLIDMVSSSSQQFLGKLKDSKEKIAEIGVKRIRDDCVILTHCHSSTVSYLLEKAKQAGKSFEVICTETRPVFQGRITAREMLDLDVKTTMIVDSAARSFVNQADFVLVGADAITSEGNVVNKIGSSMVALIAQEARTPFYVVSELMKFDPVTMYGEYEKIEERSSTEVWENAPEGLNIRNPAFDVTRRRFIHGIICEEGIISPHSVTEVVHRTYPWIFKQ